MSTLSHRSDFDLILLANRQFTVANGMLETIYSTKRFTISYSLQHDIKKMENLNDWPFRKRK